MKATNAMRRYIKGRDLTLLELIEALRRRQWVYLRDIPKHPAVIEHMTFVTILKFAEAKMFYRAIETNPKERG